MKNNWQLAISILRHLNASYRHHKHKEIQRLRKRQKNNAMAIMRGLLLAENTTIIKNVDLLIKSSKKDDDGNILAVFSLGFEKFIVLDINCGIDIRGDFIYLDYINSTVLGIKPPEFNFVELFFIENFDIIKKNLIKRCE